MPIGTIGSHFFPCARESPFDPALRPCAEGDGLSSVNVFCRKQEAVARAQEGQNASQRLGNEAFIRSIWLDSKAEETGSHHISQSGPHQLPASPEVAGCHP